MRMRRHVINMFCGFIFVLLVGRFDMALAYQSHPGYEIDWVIPKESFESATLKNDGFKHQFRIDLDVYPRRLYIVEEDIVAENNNKILPKGAQLYQMTDGASACSQVKYGAPYLSERKRVCLIDTNNDKLMDHFVSVNFGGEVFGMGSPWYSMINSEASGSYPINNVRLNEISVAKADKKLRLVFWFTSYLDNKVSVDMFLGTKKFWSECDIYSGTLGSNNDIIFPCIIPKFLIVMRNYSSKKRKERELSAILPDSEIGVRIGDIDSGVSFY